MFRQTTPQEKLPPRSPEAEQAVIGSILLWATAGQDGMDAIALCLQKLKPARR